MVAIAADDAGFPDEERSPTFEKCCKRTKRVQNVEETSTLLWKHRRKLGVRERASQRDRSSDDPHEENRTGSTELARHESRHRKDPRADDDAYRERARIQSR